MSDPPTSQNQPQPSEYPLPVADSISRVQQQSTVTRSNTEQKENDPFAGRWMALPSQVSTDSNVPPVLQRLTDLDHVIVRFTEVGQWLYKIENTKDEKIFVASRVGGWSSATTYWTPSDVRIVDESRETAIYLHFEYTCATCWCCNCRQKMEVFSPPSTLIGTVENSIIHNEGGVAEWRVKRTDCLLCRKDEFKISALNNKAVVAQITKKWAHFWSVPHYDITFPLNFDVRMKAIVISCCFLLISLEEAETVGTTSSKKKDEDDPW